MAGALPLLITKAGRDALVNAQNGTTEPIRIAKIGFSGGPFTMAPTLEVLPGEFKRIDSFAGKSVSETVIHMTGQDPREDVYDLFGIGRFLADGTLFATYAQATPIFRKVSIASFLIAFDVAFEATVAGSITFGNSMFLYPPATETTKGVAEIATEAEINAGNDDQRIVSPKKLASRLAAFLQTIFARKILTTGLVTGGGDLTSDRTINVPAASTAETSAGLIGNRAVTPASLSNVLLDIAARALKTTQVTGAGLATGGGALDQNRAITVTAASKAEARTGTATNRALTPASLGPILSSIGTFGYCTIPVGDPANTLMIQWGHFSSLANNTVTVTFPLAFSAPAFAVVTDGTSDLTTNDDENFPAVRRSSFTATGFQAFSQNDTNDECCFIAVGRIDLS